MNAGCPKCDAKIEVGSRWCAACGLAVELAGFRPGRPREGEPLRDPLLDRFERHEFVRYCPDCVGELAEGLHFCRRCERAALRAGRPQYDTVLAELPIASLAARVAPGPEPRPRDLVRVHVARSYEEAQSLAADLRFLALETWLGSDSLDPFPEWWHLGVYVRAHDEEAAKFVMAGERSWQFDTLASEDTPDTVRARIDGLLALGKYEFALATIERSVGASEEGLLAKGRALLLAARPREAERHFEAALPLVTTSIARGRLGTELGIARALGNDCEAFHPGSNVEAAERALVQAVTEGPRLLRPLKALIEVRVARRDRDGLLRALRGLERLNPNLLARDGFFRRQRAAPLSADPSWI